MSSVALDSILPGPAQGQVNSTRLRPATGIADIAPVIRRYEGKTAIDLRSHAMGSVFGSRSWVEALAAAYGIAVHASTIERNGSAKAAILFSEVEDIRGRRIISLPFSDYVDPFVEDPADWTRLVTPLLEKGVPVRFRCLRNALPAADPRFVLTGTALWHAADLTRPEAEMWSGLDNSARQNIRKAERNAVAVRQGTTLDDLRIFYGMHSHVRKSKYRLFAQPFAFFEALHAAFSPDDRIFVILAEVDGVAIGGILFLIHGDTLYYKFNASTDAVLRPNDLLVWNGMLIGRSYGLSRLDFGLSDTSQPGLVRFKQKFATEERTISILHSTPAGYSDKRGDQAGHLLHRLTEILTSPEIPDDVTRVVGDEVYRFFC